MANLISTVVNGELEASGRIITTYNTDRYQLNLRRTSGSNWWFSNDSDKLGLHLNNVGDRFYFNVDGDFWSSTNGWLSTALAGKSNVGHTHDDRYYTESESDARFQPLENQRLSTGNNVTFSQVYANNWFRNNASNTGLYNEATTMHLSSQLNGYWDMSSTTTWSGIRFYTGGHVSALRGYVYANTSNEIGFLTNDGNWGLQVDSSKNVRVYGVSLTIGNTTSSDIYMVDTDEGDRRIHCNSGKIGFLSTSNTWGSWAASDGSWYSDQSMRAPIFYDSQNTGYYLDPNSTSNLNTAYAAAFYGSDVYTTGGWFRNHTNNNGIYWQGTGWHLMPENSADFRIHSGNNSESAIRMETNGTTRGYVYANNSNEIGFLNEGRGWRLRVYSGGAVQSYGDFRAPIFYDSQDTTYYLDPNSTTALRTVGSWRADSAAWDGEFAGKIQYHSNNWYFQASSNWFFRNSGASNVVSIDSGGNISANGFVGNNSAQTRDKLRVWDSSSYTIGMKSGYDYGHLGNDEYAMSFQMNDNSGRGFWWGDDAHNDNQGAASLTTDGRMTIARSLSVGEGEAVVSPSSTPLYVKGSTSGADVVGVDGVNGRLFTVTDDLSNSLFSVNTIAGLPVIEAFADNTVNIGKYGSATTWSTTGFVTMPNSANIYRDLFINGGRGGNFGNRLIIGTDAATYTMQDGNQRPTAYLHGAYPVLTLNHTVSNGSHGPTIQLTHDTNNKQWVIGTNGTGTRLDIGYSENTNRNPHNGIDDYLGSTFFRINNGGHIELGRGNGRSTWVNDTLYVGASDSGDSHMYFGEDSSGWYGLHWYWDSAYTVYLYGRNAGTDTEIMRYTTNSNAYVEWRRHFHMNNYDINYLSQIHFNDDVRFYDDGNNQYLNFKWGNGGAGGIQFWDGDGSRQGYVYGSGTGSFGLLDSGGNWKVRVDTSNVEMYGAQYLTDVYAYILYDRSDSSYYLDPNSYSRIWRTSTHWAPSPGVGSSNWVNDFNATPVSSMSFGGDLSAGGPQGTWWFQQNMRHSNASNYWGTQIAWGWEDNANELWQRNVQGGSWSSWVRYINTNNYAGILDARYYTETEVNNLLSSYATTSSLSGYVSTTNNSSLNSDSRNTRGVTRLYRRDDNSDFSVQTHWTGTYWRLEGYNGDTYHAGVSVAHAGLADSATNANYANSAGSASNADTVDGFHASVAGSANTIPTRNASGYLIPENWIQLNGIYGLYSPTNNAHLRPNPNSYGSWLVTGGRNSWGGIEFDYGSAGPITMMIASDSNTVGFHNNTYGWQIRWANGTLYVGKNSYGGGDVAVIDANSIGSQSVNYANYSGYSNGLSRYGIIYGNDWNTYRVNGQFIVMSAHGHSGSNRPSGAYTYGSGMSYYNAGSDHYQFYFPENGGSSNANSFKIWYRSGWNDVWGGWRSIVDTYNGACAIDGTVTATGDVIAYSDARVKENVHTIENALDKTLKLRGVTYNRTDVEDKSTKIGVIAQEIMEVLPEVVSEDETGMYGVSYGNLTAVLIEAIKEQQKQIEELRNELNKLKG